MYVILKNIHETVKVDSLEQYLRPFLEGGFLRPKGELRAIIIIGLADRSGGFVERHALIRVCSDKIRRRLIKELNRQHYIDEDGQRQKVQAAEYIVRQIMNDKRVSGFQEIIIERERRKSERRRLGLKVVHIAEKDYVRSGSSSANPRF